MQGLAVILDEYLDGTWNIARACEVWVDGCVGLGWKEAGERERERDMCIYIYIYIYGRSDVSAGQDNAVYIHRGWYSWLIEELE